MSKWIAKLHVRGILHNDDTTLEQKGVAYAERITAFIKRHAPGTPLREPWFSTDELDELGMIADDLRDAGEADDLRGFDEALDSLYSWADFARVWVATV